MDQNQSNPFDAPQNAPAPDNNIAATPPVGAPQKKSKLGLILGLSIGGGVVLIAGLVILLVLLFSGVSKEEYESAYKTTNDMRTPYSKLAGVYISNSSTETQIKNYLDTIETNREQLDSDYEALGEMKAIKNDKEAQELYKKVGEEKVKLDKYMATIQEAAEKIYPVAAEISDASFSSGDYGAVMSTLRSIQTELGNLDLKQEVNKDYVSDLTKHLAQLITAVQAYVDTTATAGYASTSDIYDATSALSDDDRSYQSNLTKLLDDQNFSDAYNDLGEYLSEKTY